MLSFLLWAQAPQAMIVGLWCHDSLLRAKLCIQNQGYSEVTWCRLGKSYQKRLGFTVFEFTWVFGNKPFESLYPCPVLLTPHTVSRPTVRDAGKLATGFAREEEWPEQPVDHVSSLNTHRCVHMHTHIQFVCQRVGFTIPSVYFCLVGFDKLYLLRSSKIEALVA